MSKGLESLEELKYELCFKPLRIEKTHQHINTIEKSLKALEIVKDKIIPLTEFTMIKKLEDGNWYYTVGDNWNDDLYLSQEEYNILKEVLL